MKNLFFSIMLTVIVFLASNFTASAQYAYVDISALNLKQIEMIKPGIEPGSLVGLHTAPLTIDAMQAILKDSTFHLYHETALNEAAKPGLRIEIDAAYSPFGTFEAGMNGALLQTRSAVGINVAAVHQFRGGFYLGGGIGLKSLQLEFSEDANCRVNDSYSLPIFVRGGACTAFTEKFSGFLGIDLGAQLALDSYQTTAWLLSFQVGITYGNTRVGLGMLVVKPNVEAYLPDWSMTSPTIGFDTMPALTVGVSF